METDGFRHQIRDIQRFLIFRTLLSVLLTVVIALQPAYADRKKKILVLHSYHQGLEWTDNISQGIQDVFSPYQGEYEVYYEYLDSKRNAGASYLNEIGTFVALKNSNIEYELVIAVDNNALRMLNQKQIQFAGNPPVVFTGLNNYHAELISGLQQVTGVVETTDHRGTIDLMRMLHPESDSITVIIDQTPTGKRIRSEFRAVEQEYADIRFSFLSDFLLSDIPEIVSRFSHNELLYILTFNRDSQNNFISYTEGIEMIARHTDSPIYGSWDFYLDKGIVGGKITTGYLQGKTAGEIALRILKGEDVADIEIIANSPTRFMFDYTYMEKHGISQSQLPEPSVIINKPPGWFESNVSLLLNLFVFLFVALLIVLYFSNRKQNRLQARYTAHLEDQVRQRTETLKETNEQLQRLSEADGLSQLYNRRYFDEALEKEIQRHQRIRQPLTLMMCDIDYFKRYNDSYGHIAGDECIKQVARLLESVCKRSVDTVARYGGEEFAIVLPATGGSDAESVARRIHSRLCEAAIEHNSSLISDSVTISIGVAVITPDRKTSSLEIVSLADDALYRSKHEGRNRFTVIAPERLASVKTGALQTDETETARL